MAHENLCMYCFEDNAGQSVCPHCGRDSRAAVPQIQLLPGTLLYSGRFLVGRALGQDGGGIVYAAYDTKRGVKIRIREYLPRDCANRENTGEVTPSSGLEDRYMAGLKKLRASVEGVEDPAKRHFFFEENGTGYIAQRKTSAEAAESGDEAERRGPKVAAIVGIAAALVLLVALGVIWLVNYITDKVDTKIEKPLTSVEDVWQPPVTPTPTPYAAATFGTITDPEQSWKDYTNPEIGDPILKATPTSAPTAESGFDSNKTVNSKSSPEVIKQLQKLLINRGWLEKGSASGSYDSQTKQAVKDFQQYINDTYAFTPKLTVDGVAGPKTLEWLIRTDIAFKPTATAAPITPSPTQNRTVDENSTPEAIKYVQRQLSILGMLDNSDITGVYNKTTRSAVLAFQKRVNELQGYSAIEESGVCDASTLTYLDYYVNWWIEKRQTTKPHTTPKATPSGAVVDENSDAASIKYVQGMLIDLGYLSGKADGAYGTKTYSAVTAFQKYVNTQYPGAVSTSGKCDSVTLEYLEYYHATLETPAPSSGSYKPTISVTGYSSIKDGVYFVGKSGVKVSWSSSGANTYSVYFYDPDGLALRRQQLTKATSLTLTQDYFTENGVHTLKVVAVPNDSGETDENSAVISVALSGSSIDPTVQPSSKPELTPVITVTDAVSYTNGVYLIGDLGAGISWTSKGASRFSIYLTDDGNEIIASQRDTSVSSYRLDSALMEAGGKYVFTVVAIPDNGAEKDGEYSSVKLALGDVAAKPSTTPSPNMTAPEITVSGAASSFDGIYYVGESDAYVSWKASGDVYAYSLYLKNSAGREMTANRETNNTSMRVSPQSMASDETYTLTVVAIPAGGTEADGKSASVNLALFEGQTPEPVYDISAPDIVVSGHKAYREGVYYAGDSAMSIKWSANGDVSGYNILATGDDGNVIFEKNNVSKTSQVIDPSDMAKGVTYTFTITAIDPNGDGASSSVLLAKYNFAATAPVLTVENVVEEVSGVYYVGDKKATVNWTSEDADSYDAVLESDTGEIIDTVYGTSNTYAYVKPSAMKPGIKYRLTVTAKSKSGDASSDLFFMLYEAPDIEPPVVTVDGYADYSNGIYYINGEASISWTSGSAEKFDISLYTPSGKESKSVKDVKYLSANINSNALSESGAYAFTVTAKSGDKSASSTVYVSKYVADIPEVSAPEITVENYKEFADGIYYADKKLAISWMSEGSKTYSVFLYGENGEEITADRATEKTSVTVKLGLLEEDKLYTLTVIAIPEGGKEGDGKSSSVLLMRYSDTAGIGTPVITVNGYDEFTDGIYYIESGALSISWASDNAETYDIYLYDDEGNAIRANEDVTDTSLKLQTKSFDINSVYEFSVVAKNRSGSASDSVKIAKGASQSAPTVGYPDISVEGYEAYENETYLIGDNKLVITFAADGDVKSYSAYLYDENGNVVNSAKDLEKGKANIKPEDLQEGVIYTFTAVAVPKGGTEKDGASSSIMVALAANQSVTPVPDYIDADSDSETVLSLQKALYELGWITKDMGVKKGVFDDITIQAVFEFQSYVIDMGINPEIVMIEPLSDNPTVDAITISLIYDAYNPIVKPE